MTFQDELKYSKDAAKKAFGWSLATYSMRIGFKHGRVSQWYFHGVEPEEAIKNLVRQRIAEIQQQVKEKK